MNLVYCCKSSHFYHAVSCWMNDRSDLDSLFVLPAFKDLFMSDRSQYFFPRTSIFSFDSRKICSLLEPWALKNVAANPQHVNRINQVVKLMKDLITDETWAMRNKLLVSVNYMAVEEEEVLS